MVPFQATSPSKARGIAARSQTTSPTKTRGIFYTAARMVQGKKIIVKTIIDTDHSGNRSLYITIFTTDKPTATKIIEAIADDTTVQRHEPRQGTTTGNIKMFTLELLETCSIGGMQNLYYTDMYTGPRHKIIPEKQSVATEHKVTKCLNVPVRTQAQFNMLQPHLGGVLHTLAEELHCELTHEPDHIDYFAKDPTLVQDININMMTLNEETKFICVHGAGTFLIENILNTHLLSPQRSQVPIELPPPHTFVWGHNPDQGCYCIPSHHEDTLVAALTDEGLLGEIETQSLEDA